MIGEGRVVLLGPVRQELLSGMKVKAQFDLLRDHLRSFPDLELDSADYEEAAAAFNRCRERGEEDIRAYFLSLRDDRQQAPSSINIALCALRFFCNFTLQRDFKAFQLLRVSRPRSLPVVLSQKAVRSLLGVIRHPVRRMTLATIYALGLRIGEGLRLETKDIDSGRQMVWIRDGKGAKDRRVPLPKHRTSPLVAPLAAVQHDAIGHIRDAISRCFSH